MQPDPQATERRRFVLLTGAGFTRNWGGWIASEFFETLLSYDLNAFTKSVLWKERNFESVLSKLRGPLRTEMDSVFSAVFGRMNSALAGRRFEFSEEDRRSIVLFLTRFDAIFTLNQDLLLEYHCERLGSKTIEMRRISQRLRSPGVHQVGCAPDYPIPAATVEHVPSDDPSDYSIGEDVIPYIKLHGSSNWKESDGGNLLIMGNNKAQEIGLHPLLATYWSAFEDCLSKPETRLMVIGYGFRDPHVNTAIAKAAESGSLKMFIIDPSGVDILGPRRDPQTLKVNNPDPVLAPLKGALIGASRRSLGEIFGGDDVELEKVMQFFK
ncbi:SIR2 family protein [Bauldia litoralis]|uniref:SIR2-like domain-containing protein n=1 Tax=Bauldia litoralis TaxID=665467 RepID=A0A1G6D4B0_9HYPH|nr:SIR2 family protein [Bauldia litoralis]SDB39996.1 SIR2-like domain-containing protein [Bauldia litoralis]